MDLNIEKLSDLEVLKMMYIKEDNGLKDGQLVQEFLNRNLKTEKDIGLMIY